MLTLMLFFASRDPARNMAIVDAVIMGSCILAHTPLLSLYTLDIHKIYPGYLVWGRSLVRLAIAALLYLLKPRRNIQDLWADFDLPNCALEDTDLTFKCRSRKLHCQMGGLA